MANETQIYTLDYGAGSKAAFVQTQGTSTTQYVGATTIIPPCYIVKDGMQINYPKGLLAVLYYCSDANNLRVDCFDLATGLLADDMTCARFDSYSSGLTGGGVILPLGASTPGYIVFAGSGNNFYQRWGWFSDSGNNIFTSHGGPVAAAAITRGNPGSKFQIGPTCIARHPRTATPQYWFGGHGRESAGGAPTIVSIAHNFNNSWSSPAEQDIFTLRSTWAYPNGTYGGVTWSDSPINVMRLQPTVDGTYLVALIVGSGGSPDPLGIAAPAPRLALISLTGAAAGQIKATTAPGSGMASGMVMNQYGDIYVTGTRSLTSSAPNLVERYTIYNLAKPAQAVAYGAGGLGSGTANADSSHVITPTWDGSNLIVQDHDDAQTRLFVYDRYLTLVRSFTISTTPAPSGPRLKTENCCASWWGEAY